MRAIPLLYCHMFRATLVGCGGGGEHPTPVSSPTSPVISSSAMHSGAMSAYLQEGVVVGIAPGRTVVNRALLRIVHDTADDPSALQSRLHPLSLRNISGTSIDPTHGVGAAFDYRDTRLSLFRISDGVELNIYLTQDIFGAPTLTFGGAKGVYTSGIILDAASQRLIAATSRGFLFIDYHDPQRPTLTHSIASLEVDPANGVEIIEHFALHPTLRVGDTRQPFLFSGGNYQNRTGDALVIIDINAGEVFRPDAATKALFIVDQYIDSIALDTVYNVALLSDEGSGLTFVDLNQLQINATDHTFHLPVSAVTRDTTVTNFTQVAISPQNHLVLFGAGMTPAHTYFIAELSSPATTMGFARRSPVLTMPDIVLANGKHVPWSGAQDPHAVVAVATDSTVFGYWMNDRNNAIATFDINAILKNSTSQVGYDPATASPPATYVRALP